MIYIYICIFITHTIMYTPIYIYINIHIQICLYLGLKILKCMNIMYSVHNDCMNTMHAVTYFKAIYTTILILTHYI